MVTYWWETLSSIKSDLSAHVTYWVSHSTNSISHIKDKINLVFMHSGFVNRHHDAEWRSCCARRTSGSSSLFSIQLTVLFFCYIFRCVCHSHRAFSFLECLYNLCLQSKKGSRLNLMIPNEASLFGYPWWQNDLIFLWCLNSLKNKANNLCDL